MAPVEVLGDSAAGDQFAYARLVVDAGVVVEADVVGLERDLVGLTVLEAAAVPGERLAADALANALSHVITAPPDPTRIAVAMSGGVDSAVALLRAGDNAVGVTLRLWVDPAAQDGERVCCSPAAVIAARETCHSLGLPHLTLDLREAFREVVVGPFMEAYASGTTPNPCVRCNGAFRFDALVDCARTIGASALWTGHYARVVERNGRHLVARGADPVKDQSYMLATVSPDILSVVAFPLGEETKDSVRSAAAAAGLAAATRAESQEACFLGGDDYRVFLKRHGMPDAPGAVVDTDGIEVGRHDGLWRFTPGQRKGLGVALGEPMYAVRAESSTNTLVVGPRRALEVTRLEARGVLYVPAREVEVKFRYRSAPVPATVEVEGEMLMISLHRPAEAVAPGQLAALYDGATVVGAGVIVSTSA